MVAGDWLAKRMYDLGYIQKLDKEALAPAFEHLSPDVKAPSSDPNWDFSIPWQGGMTGLIVNKEEAPDIRSVNDLFDPQYKGKVEMLTELREAVPLVMKADGIDPEDATEEDWLAAIDKIKEARRVRADPPLHRWRLRQGPGHRRRGRGDGLGRRRDPAAGRQPAARVADARPRAA